MGHFVDYLKILGQVNFLFHGLVLDTWGNSEILYELKDFFTIVNFSFHRLVLGILKKLQNFYEKKKLVTTNNIFFGSPRSL